MLARDFHDFQSSQALLNTEILPPRLSYMSQSFHDFHNCSCNTTSTKPAFTAANMDYIKPPLHSCSLVAHQPKIAVPITAPCSSQHSTSTRRNGLRCAFVVPASSGPVATSAPCQLSLNTAPQSATQWLETQELHHILHHQIDN